MAPREERPAPGAANRTLARSEAGSRRQSSAAKALAIGTLVVNDAGDCLLARAALADQEYRRAHASGQARLGREALHGRQRAVQEIKGKAGNPALAQVHQPFGQERPQAWVVARVRNGRDRGGKDAAEEEAALAGPGLTQRQKLNVPPARRGAARRSPPGLSGKSRRVRAKAPLRASAGGVRMWASTSSGGLSGPGGRGRRQSSPCARSADISVNCSQAALTNNSRRRRSRTKTASPARCNSAVQRNGRG